MRRLPNNQMEFNIGLGVKAHSLDVVADIIGTMRMQKIIEITENVQPNEKERIEQLDKELHILTIEEKSYLDSTHTIWTKKMQTRYVNQ